MPALIRQLIASGDGFAQVVGKAPLILAEEERAPEGARFEWVMHFRDIVVFGRDYTPDLVRAVAWAFNTAIGQWTLEQVGEVSQPWPGEEQIAFAEPDNKRVVLRWVKGQAFFQAFVSFLQSGMFKTVIRNFLVFTGAVLTALIAIIGVVGWLTRWVVNLVVEVSERAATSPLVWVVLAVVFGPRIIESFGEAIRRQRSPR